MSPYREIEQIRNSAGSLKKEAEGATGEEKRLLLRSADELEGLADAMKPGDVTAGGGVARGEDVGRRIDGIFARAHHALARHHHRKAKRSWDTGESTQAGHALKAGATHLQQGLVWVDQKLEEGAAHAIATLHRLAEQVLAGGGVPPAEVGTGMEALGVEIEKLGTRAESLKAR